MNHEELYAEGFPQTWDNTMRVQAAQCPRKWYFFMRRYDYVSTPSYFVWGQAWGEMQTYWYQCPYEEISDPLNPMYLVHREKAIRAGEAHWDSLSPVEKGLNKRATLRIIFENYLEENPSEPWRYVPMGAEAGWQYPLPGTDYFLGGAFDGYVEWPGHGYLVKEDKTAGEYLSDNYKMQWEFSPQITGYIWYLSQIHGTELVKGCLMNLVTKHMPGPRSKWTTPRTARTIVTKSAKQLEEFARDAAFQITRFEDEFWNQEYFPKTLAQNQCTGGAGFAPCLFKVICRSDADFRTANPAQFPDILELEETWKPWERAGDQTEA
jgi:hypothetical protein